MELNKFFRPNILALTPYSCARDEFAGFQNAEAVFLDANENPYPNGCNRYPDPRHTALRQRIAQLRGVAPQRIIMGNGSDEIIDLLIRSTCRPALDNIVVFSPGYSVYEVSAAINDVQVRSIDLLLPDFRPDVKILSKVADANTKLVFLCSPNNPTGNVIPLSTVERICSMLPDSLVVVDEAYIDFADMPSATTLLDTADNLLVLQTLSKAWGMAGLRIGIGIGREDVVTVLGKVKPPYNIGGMAQQMALDLLADTDGFERRVAEIKCERGRMFGELTALGIFSRVLPSSANYILVFSPQCRAVHGFLAENGVVVRLRDQRLIPDGLRITVGTPEENDRLLELLKARI